MDTDKWLMVATLGAVFPYVAVALGDWLMRHKRDRQNGHAPE